MRAVADRDRGTATERGYDAQWRKLRLLKLEANPLCECNDCLAGKKRYVAAEVVDHIIAIESQPELRLVWENLRSMAKRCHDRHTALTRGFGRARRG